MARVGRWTWEPATDFIQADKLSCQLWGLAPQRPIDLGDLRARIHVDDLPRLDAALRQCLREARRTTLLETCRCQHADGSERWILFTVMCLPPGVGGERIVLGTSLDVTDRKQSETRLHDDRRRLDKRMRRQQEQVAAAVHDVRNDLALLQSALHLSGKVEGRHFALDLQAQIGRIALTLNQLLHVFASEGEAEPDTTLACEAEHQRRNLEPMSSPYSAAAEQPRRILVADDNADAARALALMLRMDGHDVRIALNGQEALDLAEQSHPEVLLLDIAMPIKDGLAVAREIKSQPWGIGCALIAMTARNRPEDRELTSDAGFMRHLAKPLNFDEVSRLVAGVRH
jgi:PAS domain S-box-containing protein